MIDSLNKLEISLSSAVAVTMENMTFEVVEIVDVCTDRELVDDLVWAALPMVRPYEGQLVVEVTPEHGRFLAEEIYRGVDEGISEDTIKDVVKEIANTIAGRFLNGLVSPDQELRFGLPRTGVGVAPEGSQKVASILMNVGDHTFMTSVTGNDFSEFVNE